MPIAGIDVQPSCAAFASFVLGASSAWNTEGVYQAIPEDRPPCRFRSARERRYHQPHRGDQRVAGDNGEPGRVCFEALSSLSLSTSRVHPMHR